ncbi:MAG: 3-hexulose-6-phosphate synthase [Planctomycetota bacterium]
MEKNILQVALDFTELSRAIKAAKEAVEGGADWLEAGTPLIKSEGLDAIRELKRLFPDIPIVADMKTMDVGRLEVEIAAKAGAFCVTVLGAASSKTIEESVEAGKNYGAAICVDLLGVEEDKELIEFCEKIGVDHFTIHLPVDEQMLGSCPVELVKKVRSLTKLPISVAGGIHSENVAEIIKGGADIIIVGGAITKSEDARKATQDIKRAMVEKIVIPTRLYKRVSEDRIKDIFIEVSTPNISDAMHRGGVIEGIYPVTGSCKMVGRAVTVRTYPGDWAKPVEAIDVAGEDNVIVVDAGGLPPAVWGELATHSAINKKIAGVVIYGGIRDIDEIRKLKFPAFTKIICPNAGEPKGFGEINIPIKINNIIIEPGDWIIGDDNGLVRVPKKDGVEIANRAMDVLEKENRIRKEIKEGGTLSSVTELLRWEKTIVK